MIFKYPCKAGTGFPPVDGKMDIEWGEPENKNNDEEIGLAKPIMKMFDFFVEEIEKLNKRIDKLEEQSNDTRTV